tara:strand:+ start:112 stop:555 length:444 start_codon:yes stop_codon:yes gene_type:complete
MREIILIIVIMIGCLSSYGQSKLERDTIEIPQQKKGEEVYVIVQTMPQFKDSKTQEETSKELIKYFKSKMDEDRPTSKGTVYMSFIIDKEGKVTEVFLLEGVNSELDELAKRYIKEMPLWTSGLQKGNKVKVQLRQAITFSKYKKNR